MRCPLEPGPGWRVWRWGRREWAAVWAGFGSLGPFPPRQARPGLSLRASRAVREAAEHVVSCPRCRFAAMTTGLGKPEHRPEPDDSLASDLWPDIDPISYVQRWLRRRRPR